MRIFRLFVFVCFLFIWGKGHSSNILRKERLDELDRIVDARMEYMQRKENRIDSLKSLLGNMDLVREFEINRAIYREYNTYRSDSAWVYVKKNEVLAEAMGSELYATEMVIANSFLLSTVGMYQESLDNLAQVNRDLLSGELLREYYEVSEWSYYVAAEYTNDFLYSPVYRQKEYAYRDSIISVLVPGSIQFDYYMGKRYIHEREYAKAEELLLGLYPRLNIDTRLYAVVTYDLAAINRTRGNWEEFERFIIQSAISDQVCPLKENLAMQEFSIYLYTYHPEELDRAYRYIQCSLEDARFYNNRLRMVQIAEKLPVIVEAYQRKSEAEKEKLTYSLFVISLLTLATVISLFYLYRQHCAVRKNREALHRLNEELNLLNRQLKQSNQTKEQYVGIFMDLCSSYIEKLNKFRETVKRKIVAKQFDDLYKQANSTLAIETEVDNFLHNFDRAFLTLFPTFVADFNDLLTEEGQIRLKKGELLNAELRIFALIRLGITESSQIATFLRYSPQTIYNYRTRIKSRYTGDRDKFEDEIMLIGNK